MAATKDYFSDLEGFGSGPALPSPSDTPYHTPRPSMSRRSSRRGTSSRAGSSSPPPLPTSSPAAISSSSPATHSGEDYKNGQDIANNENISILDPRRFTPTLHASLVSEILTLRRELESKHQFIEELEVNLAGTKIEKDEISEKLVSSDKERRSLKRQFQQLEHGTLAALEELARDRDRAKALNTDLREKLEAAQKRVRTHEEDAERIHSLWDKDRKAWDAEKRGLERRAHITETRLKAVLEELAAQHEAAQYHHNGVAGEEDDNNTKDSGLGEDGSDTASIRSGHITGSPRKRHARTFSRSSQRSLKGYRISTQSLMGPDGHKLNGISLADELQLDEEDEDYMDIMDDDEGYPEHEARARRALESRLSHHNDDKAKRLLGLIPHSPTKATFDYDAVQSPPRTFELDRSQEGRSTPIPRVHYVESATQFSPPPSPVLTPSSLPSKPPTLMLDAETQTHEDEADSAKKVPPVITLLIDRGSQMSPIPQPHLVDRGQQMSPVPEKPLPIMISASAQTIESPLSPPQTPKISPPPSPIEADESLPAIPALPLVDDIPAREMATSGTQTDPLPEPKSIPELFSSTNRAAPPAPLPIPSIVINPPLSAPPSPREPILPPGTKSAGSQTPSDLVPTRSASAQTEEIRFNKLLLTKLPLHLQPSSISSKPPTPEPGKQRSVSERSPLKSPMSSSAERSPIAPEHSILKKAQNRHYQRSPPPLQDDLPSSPPTLSSPIGFETRYPGNNDNGPLVDDRLEGPSAPRRPFRDSSLFAGFDQEEQIQSKYVQSRFDRGDDEPRSPTFQTPAMPSRTFKHTRHFGNRPSPVPEDKEVESKPRAAETMASSQPEPAGQYSPSAPASGRPSLDSRPSFDKSRGKQPLRSGGQSRQSSMRRSAMIQNGASAHAQRSRTPSIVSVGSSATSNKSAGPPFPVPDRASSRRLFPLSKSEGSQSPTPRSGGIFGSRRQPRQIQRKDSLRKVRSATTIQRSNSKGRQRSRSPPLDARPDSPSFPPLPKDNIAIPQKVYASQREARRQESGRGSPAQGKTDVDRASQGGVVDAIASCMVGEWMYKYVRRRKSFGVQESPQEPIGRPGTDGSVNVTGNGVRHKRWVWLSPYERAVMWSSKQPVSNSALMGKSGRKLIIQSVLDVRDDTPLPKNHGIAEPFNRSILILTPARALKFTAMSRERHYTWLTALSFLAHSPLLAPGLADMPKPPQEPEMDNSGRAPSLRRAQIRDSVRIAKNKARPQPGRNPATVHTPGGSEGSTRLSPMALEFPRSVSTGSMGGHTHPLHAHPLTGDDIPLSDSAEPPSVPRFHHHHNHNHGRKRSLTGPSRHFPPSALRNMAYAQSPALPAFPSAASSDYGSVSASGGPGPSLLPSARTSASASDASAAAAARRNFFDAVGTMRMEAFVEDGGDGSSSAAVSVSGFGLPRRSGGGAGFRRNSGWSGSTGNMSGSAGDARRSGIVYPDDFDAFDPFRGF